MDLSQVNIGDVINIASNIVSIAAVVAAVTPSPADDGVVAVLRKVLDFLACNWGNAKNGGK